MHRSDLRVQAADIVRVFLILLHGRLRDLSRHSIYNYGNEAMRCRFWHIAVPNGECSDYHYISSFGLAKSTQAYQIRSDGNSGPMPNAY
jgi:hypothetical protein